MRVDSRAFWVVIMALCVLGPCAQAGEEAEKPEKVLDVWLAAGPIALPVPSFAKQEAEDATADLLDASHLRLDLVGPNVGERMESIGGELIWQALRSGANGHFELEASQSIDPKKPQVAWIATNIRTTRFVKVTLEIKGEHPLQATVNGKDVDDGSTLGLATGTHRILAKIVRDPEVTEPWSYRVSLRGAFAESITCSPDTDRDLGILDVTDQTAVTDFDVSPMGDQVVLAVSRIRPGTDSRENWVELRSTDDGSILRTWRGPGNMSQVEFAPTGRRISFVSRDEKKSESSLWVHDLSDGTARVVVEALENFSSYLWSPTGDALVYSLTDEAEKDESGITRLRGLLDRMAGNRDVSSLYHVSFGAGLTRRLTSGNLSANAAAFSPDGTRLLVTRESEDLENRPYSRTEIWQLNLVDGRIDKLRDGRWIQDLSYGPDGRLILVQAGPSEFGAEGMEKGLEAPVNDYDGQLFVWNPESGAIDPITREFAPSVASARWSSYDGAIYVLAADGHRRSLFRFSHEDRRFERILIESESISSFDIADRSPIVIAAGTSVWQPQRIVALDRLNDKPRLIIEPAAERFAAVQKGVVTTWNFTAADGREVPGRVYLPVGFTEDRLYPAIVNYYGGTSPMSRSFGGRYPAEWWAANGYVVYVLTPTGAYGWGQEASTVHVNDWGEVTSRQIIEATTAFLESHPFVDRQKVGCIGASYGGFMTMTLVTKTDIFAAAVAHAGISALSSYWGEGYWGYSYGAVANAGSFPWNRRDLFVDRSPLFSADKVSTPILLTHGEDDPNVPPGESDQFYAALKLLGVEAEYLRIADLGHLIMAHDKRVLWSQSIVAWFDRFLKDQPDWWVYLYPEP